MVNNWYEMKFSMLFNACKYCAWLTQLEVGQKDIILIIKEGVWNIMVLIDCLCYSYNSSIIVEKPTDLGDFSLSSVLLMIEK